MTLPWEKEADLSSLITPATRAEPTKWRQRLRVGLIPAPSRDGRAAVHALLSATHHPQACHRNWGCLQSHGQPAWIISEPCEEESFLLEDENSHQELDGISNEPEVLPNTI